MIGCFAAFGSKPLAFEAEPFLIDSFIGDLSNKPSDNVSKIVFACATSFALSNAFNTLTFLPSKT